MARNVSSHIKALLKKTKFTQYFTTHINNIPYTYILAANSTAMELYKISKETLMESNSCDFMVFKLSEWEEDLKDLEEWEESIPIDEPTYWALYSNLCIKLRRFFKTPNPDPVLWL